MPHLDPSVIVGVLGVIGAILIWLVRKGYPVIQAAVHLAELITGKPAVGKIPRVPGLGERLANIDYQLTTNSGESLRDLVTQTKNLAVQNAADAKDAKAQAAQAATAAAEVAETLATTTAEAKLERHVQAQALDGLLAGLSDFANESHAKEVAVLRALKGIGIDLPEIVGDL